MLLHTAPSFDLVAEWTEHRIVTDEASGLVVDMSVAIRGHSVSVRTGDGDAVGAELIGPTELAGTVSPVSSFHLPPYYQWQESGCSFVFATEWREGESSVAATLRHLRSLRRHPGACLVVDPTQVDELDGAPVVCVVAGAAKTPQELTDREPRPRVEWRAWHVVDVDDPFDGHRRRVLATHTEVWR